MDSNRANKYYYSLYRVCVMWWLRFVYKLPAFIASQRLEVYMEINICYKKVISNHELICVYNSEYISMQVVIFPVRSYELICDGNKKWIRSYECELIPVIPCLYNCCTKERCVSIRSRNMCSRWLSIIALILLFILYRFYTKLSDRLTI